jgi:hypothetical protein
MPDVNVFIREIVVHDTRESGDGAGEYDIAFSGGVAGDAAGMKSSPRWANSVRRGETYEVLEWIGPFTVSDSGVLTVAARGQEKDRLFGSDPLLGGLAHLSGEEQWGIGKWWRTTNGKHFDFTFAVGRAEQGHAGRPPLTGQVGEINDAPGPGSPAAEDYPASSQ